MSYILKADTSEGTMYYMNIICVSEQVENAEQFESREQAEEQAEHFKNMFHYEEITPVIEEYAGQ